MSVLLRAAWGCLFVALSLSTVGEVFWRSLSDGLVWRVVLIATVGFGPLLFPIGNVKFLCYVWGFLGSFLLLEQYYVDATNYVLVAWGPLMLVTVGGEWLRVRRDMGFSKGESVLCDQTGRRADWTFQADGLEIAVDLAARELRVRARRARWYDASFSANDGPVTLRRPLLECAFELQEVQKTEYRGTVANVYGRTYSGESLCVSVPQEGYAVEYMTGEVCLVIAHSPAEWQVSNDRVSRWIDNSLQYHGRVERKAGGRDITVELGPLPKDVSAKLRTQWKSAAEPQIAALEATFKSSLLAEAEAAAMDTFLRAERARADT